MFVYSVWWVFLGIPDVRLSAAGTGDLVLGKVGIVWRGDEVVGQRTCHVLVDSGMVGIKHIVLQRQHVHSETILSH